MVRKPEMGLFHNSKNAPGETKSPTPHQPADMSNSDSVNPQQDREEKVTLISSVCAMQTIEDKQKQAENLLDQAARLISQFEDPDDSSLLLERNGELLSHSSAILLVANMMCQREDAEKASTNSKRQRV